MVQKYIIDKADIHNLLTGKEIPLGQGSKARAFCIEIAGGMTNGEVIQALFPEARKSEFEYTYSECIKLPYHTKHDTGLLFDKDWWNAPYQKGGE